MLMERKAYPSDLTDEQWDMLKPYIPEVHRVVVPPNMNAVKL
jgi:hypothetical protein